MKKILILLHKKIVTFFFFFLGWGVILESVKEQKKRSDQKSAGVFCFFLFDSSFKFFCNYLILKGLSKMLSFKKINNFNMLHKF